MSMTPHDSFDDLIAAELNGQLSAEELTAFELRLKNDPAARGAYQESKLMHDLLEKTHREAQPDPAFEQRMVSGVRRKIQREGQAGETAWESVQVLWRGMKGAMGTGWALGGASAVLILCLISFGTMGQNRRIALLGDLAPMQQKRETDAASANAKLSDNERRRNTGTRILNSAGPLSEVPQGLAVYRSKNPNDKQAIMAPTSSPSVDAGSAASSSPDTTMPSQEPVAATVPNTPSATTFTPRRTEVEMESKKDSNFDVASNLPSQVSDSNLKSLQSSPLENSRTADKIEPNDGTVRTASTPVPDTRKLIRNAQLNLEVKSYQAAVDEITALTRTAAGYVDTSNSQKGGNGKLQGTMVVKILPQNLDAFLLKLRGLGEIKNQAVSTDDVTKEYFDTQARLDNARRMETQLQELLKRDNGKVAELLQVERELGRVRGEIEQMQGALKLYDFQVQYATVTLSVQEKDLNQAAAYLLQEHDDFSLFATDVEGTFQHARQAADDFKAHILTANLNHNSGSDISALLVVSVPPEQIEAFLAQVRGLGRVANFTRQTTRVARDGGNAEQPSAEASTEKDKVLVNLNIRSDDESRKQVAMTVVTPAVDDALEKAKAAALASPGTEVVSSSLNKAAQGPSTAQISVRVPGKNYAALLANFRALGRTSAFTLQRDDNSGPNAAGDDVPVILSLSLTDDELPSQQTSLAVVGTDVDAKAQALKRQAVQDGAEVKASSFERQPDGMELAQMTFRVPLAKYADFLAKLKREGRVETLTVRRQDRPDQAALNDAGPAEINFQLRSESPLVADDSGVWATLRRTLGEGVAALFGSVRVIGVLMAFLIPWLLALAAAAWVGRRIYVRRKTKAAASKE